jgi:hypothetical protein
MKARVAIVLIFLFACFAVAAEKVEPAPALPDSVPAPIRSAVDPKGLRVNTDSGPVADIWLSTSVPAGAKQEAGNVLYPELKPGTFVGVLSFPNSGSDFRGQTIPAGYYTLRYELLPEDGNHMGVAPNRDFLLLVPVAVDPGPTVRPNYDELVKLSAKASGTSHPAVMAMVPAAASPQPTAGTNADGYVVFSAKMKTSSGELPFSLVVKGQAAQ